jgi:hypothetical protein
MRQSLHLQNNNPLTLPPRRTGINPALLSPPDWTRVALTATIAGNATRMTSIGPGAARSGAGAPRSTPSLLSFERWSRRRAASLGDGRSKRCRICGRRDHQSGNVQPHARGREINHLTQDERMLGPPTELDPVAELPAIV